MSLFVANCGVNAKPSGGGAPTGPAEIAAVGSIEYGGASSINFTPTMPSHQANDILLVSVPQHATGGTGPVTATSGWAQVGKHHTGGGMRGTWLWKRAVGSGTPGPTITSDQNADCYAKTYVISGCVTTGTPYEDETLRGATFTPNALTSSIDTTGDDRLVLAELVVFENQNLASYPPSGWTDESNLTDTNGLGTRMAMMSQVVPSAGNVPQATFGGLSGGAIDIDIWESITLAFISA